MFPDAAHSKIGPAEKEDVPTITAVKLAGSKGSGQGHRGPVMNRNRKPAGEAGGVYVPYVRH